MKVTIGGYYSKIDEGLVKPLRQYPNLKCLRIRAKSLSDNDLVALTTFPSLEVLYLPCGVPDFMMEKLRSHIPKIIIE